MGEITRKKKKINWFMVMLLVPALAMLTVTIIIPVFVVVGMSFFHYNLLDMSNIKWVRDGHRPVFYRSGGGTAAE